MKKYVRFLAIALIAVTAIAVFTGCGNAHKDPKSVSKAYVSASANLNVDKMFELFNYTGSELETAKNLSKAALDKMTDDQKAEAKSYRFKSYEKTIGTETNETGKITISYKKDGKGDTLEKTETVNFKKVDGKWYITGSLGL